jgi:2-polyprenyl-3-methyl-5-hydroxy-6-metoxy-1,4-benzoquinol methylase
MAANGVPHRDWHPHRFWEYGSMLQQLSDLGIPSDVEIVDVGAGASFFDPYLALLYPKLCEIDSMKYGDVTPMVDAQREHYKVSLPLYDLALEDLSPIPTGKFDVSMCISTIEHVDDHDAAMRELVRVTKPGGYIFITSDYFKSPEHWEISTSKHLQITPYTKQYVQSLPERFGVEFVGEEDLDYCGDFVQNYSFCNVCLRKPS